MLEDRSPGDSSQRYDPGGPQETKLIVEPDGTAAVHYIVRRVLKAVVVRDDSAFYGMDQKGAVAGEILPLHGGRSLDELAQVISWIVGRTLCTCTAGGAALVRWCNPDEEEKGNSSRFPVGGARALASE
jgi:hypothetical protein